MALRTLSAVAAALVCLAAAACGGTPREPHAAGSAGEEFFPLVPGARWVYELRTNLGTLELEVTARGEMELPGRELPVFVVEENNRGPALGFVEMAPVAYVVDDAYISRIAGVDYDAARHLRSLGQDEPTWILPRDPRPGDTWEQITRLFQTPEGGGGRLGWSGTVLPFASVEVPAGSFEDCAAVEIVYQEIDADGSRRTAVIYEDYYARGVGLVRSLTRDPSGDPANEVELKLVEYGFPE